jgi:hypothetical protein
MTAGTTPPLHVLRGILRHIRSVSKQAKTNVTGPNPLGKHVLRQYRSSQHVGQDEGSHLRKVAYDYFVLKRDLVERAKLHELDGGAEIKLSPRELSRRAAARAGLQLPETVPL